MENKKLNFIDSKKINKQNIMAFVYWGQIKSTDRFGDSLEVVDLYNGQPFNVHGKSLIENALSADYYAEEVKVSKTKAAEFLSTSFHVPLTVSFEKQDGKERILRGRLMSTEPLLGRSYVEDLDIEGDSKKRLRLVDHRTIRWIIVQGTKYVVNQ